MLRRNLLRGLSALPFMGVGQAASAQNLTPSAAEGPFYPSEAMRFEDDDNDLVKIQDRVEAAGGEVMTLKGRILDRRGKPVKYARVEIWQCDGAGRYLHTGDQSPQPRDPAFQGYGHYITAADGAYVFRTIKPVPYTGRTPHIHVKVFAGRREFTTQFYLKDHPLNARDVLFNRLPRAARSAVEMVIEQGEAKMDIFLRT